MPMIKLRKKCIQLTDTQNKPQVQTHQAHPAPTMMSPNKSIMSIKFINKAANQDKKKLAVEKYNLWANKVAKEATHHKSKRNFEQTDNNKPGIQNVMKKEELEREVHLNASYQNENINNRNTLPPQSFHIGSIFNRSHERFHYISPSNHLKQVTTINANHQPDSSNTISAFFPKSNYKHKDAHLKYLLKENRNINQSKFRVKRVKYHSKQSCFSICGEQYQFTKTNSYLRSQQNQKRKIWKLKNSINPLSCNHEFYGSANRYSQANQTQQHELRKPYFSSMHQAMNRQTSSVLPSLKIKQQIYRHSQYDSSIPSSERSLKPWQTQD